MNRFVFLLLLLGACTTMPVSEDMIFKFNPPEGSFVQTIVATKVRDFPGEKQVDVSESVTQFIVKKTSSGFSLVATPKSFSLTRDGEKVDSPLFAQLQGMAVVYDIDSSGQLKRVYGFENVLRKLRESVPLENRAAQAALSDEAIVNREMTDWNGRFGLFAGRRFEIGDDWVSVDAYSLPTGGDLKYFVVTRIAEQVRCGRSQCVKVVFNYTNDAEVVKHMLSKVTEDMARYVNMSLPVIVGVHVGGGGERVIEWSTMRIYNEKVERSIIVDLGAQGNHSNASIVDVREYRFEYD